MSDSPKRPLSDKQKAFKEYKRETARTGKPFLPYGTYHDVIAGTVVMLLIILLTTVWFAQANCDAWFDVSCPDAASPTAQEQVTPDRVGSATFEAEDGTWIFVTSESDVPAGAKMEMGDDAAKSGDVWTETTDGDTVHYTTSYDNIPADVEPNEDIKTPLLGPLYEDIADPATTAYHPRPEWYFYFLFELLKIFSNPNLVVLGTIGVPTICLVLLMLFPFIDRSPERRPTRRPVAMVGMGVTAVVLIALSFAGAGGGEGGSFGTPEQQEMTGYALLFDDARATCAGCHTLGEAWTGTLGPDLTLESEKNRGIEWQLNHLKDPKSEVPNSSMPAQTVFKDDELLEIAAFLETLGAPDRATDSKYTKPVMPK